MTIFEIILIIVAYIGMPALIIWTMVSDKMYDRDMNELLKSIIDEREWDKTMRIPTVEETHDRMIEGRNNIDMEYKKQVMDAGKEVLKDIDVAANRGQSSLLYFENYLEQYKYDWVLNNIQDLEYAGYTVNKSKSITAYSISINWDNESDKK